jgi:hypothetical protein
MQRAACQGGPHHCNFPQKLTVICVRFDAPLAAPCVLMSVTKYVYVVLFFTLLSVKVVVGAFTVPMTVNNVRFAAVRVVNEPKARQTV